MTEKDDLEELDDPVAGLLGAALVRRLRLRHGLQGAAEKTGLSARILQRYEKGEAAPPPKTLALLGRQAGYTRHLLDHLRSALAANRLAEAAGLAGEPGSPSRPRADEVIAAALAAVETADSLLVVEPAPAPWEETGKPRAEDRRRADELWRRFISLARDRRYRLVRDSSAFRLWSFAERLAHESEAAADSPADALDLARLALEVARDVRGAPSWRARVEAYVLPFVGNAHRVCNSIEPAREAFLAARKLRSAFAPSDPPLLDESRLPDPEASLRS